MILSDLINRRSLQLARHCVPLFHYDKKRSPEICGSSLLLQNVDRMYLVTAAHVLDPLRVNEPIFFYSDSENIIQIGGSFHSSSPHLKNERNGDKVDIAIWRIPDECISMMSTYQPVPISQLKPDGADRRGKTYGVVGYPCTLSKADFLKKTLTTKVLCYYNPAFELSEYGKFGFDAKTHIIVKYDRKRVVSPNGDQQISPDPHGLSGSPLWIFFDQSREERVWMEPIVGIVVEHNPLHKGIIATGIQHVLRFFSSNNGV